MLTQQGSARLCVRDEKGFNWSMQAALVKLAPLFPAKDKGHVLFAALQTVGLATIAICLIPLFSPTTTLEEPFWLQEGLLQRPDWGHAFRVPHDCLSLTAPRQGPGRGDCLPVDSAYSTVQRALECELVPLPPTAKQYRTGFIEYLPVERERGIRIFLNQRRRGREATWTQSGRIPQRHHLQGANTAW